MTYHMILINLYWFNLTSLTVNKNQNHEFSKNKSRIWNLFMFICLCSGIQGPVQNGVKKIPIVYGPNWADPYVEKAEFQPAGFSTSGFSTSWVIFQNLLF